MNDIFLFLMITFALMLPLFVEPKSYLLETYDAFLQDGTDKSDEVSVIKSDNSSRSLKRRSATTECKSTKGNSCVFPFKFKGVEYNSCTDVGSENGMAWCATEVDNNGVAVNNTWEDCEKGCPGTGYVSNNGLNVSTNEAKAFETEIEKKNSGYKLFEGDMILSPSQLSNFGPKSSVQNSDPKLQNSARVGHQWPNNKMYYTFDKTVKEGFKNTIRSAVKEIAELLNGCVEIEEGISANKVIVSAKKNGICASDVGVAKEFGNTLNLDPNGCTSKHTIQHEFIHSLGIYHHQGRKDRDKYIKIKWNNIETGKNHNFQIKQDSNRYNLPYDYDSIMHYEEKAFSKNGAPTIETRNPANQKKIGIQGGISPGDIKLLKAYYKCGGAPPAPSKHVHPKPPPPPVQPPKAPPAPSKHVHPKPPPPPVQPPKGSCVQHGIAIWMGKYLLKKIKSTTAKKCAQECNKLSKCGFWNWNGPDICILKDNSSQIKPTLKNGGYSKLNSSFQSGPKGCNP